jgi:glucan phosphoethanolaminetransferase (alkaline phosphatase superfamily)
VLLAFAVCFWLWFEHTAVWQENFQMSAEKCRLDGLCLSSGGPHAYGFLSERYFYILIFLAFFFFGGFIKHKTISLAVCLASLALTAYQFSQIYWWYSQLLSQFADYETKPVFSLLRGAVPYVWICGGVILFLVLLQVLIFFRSPSHHGHLTD